MKFHRRLSDPSRWVSGCCSAAPVFSSCTRLIKLIAVLMTIVSSTAICSCAYGDDAQVITVKDRLLTITSSFESPPQIGALVEVLAEASGSEPVRVATARIVSVRGQNVLAVIDRTVGRIEPGQNVRMVKPSETKSPESVPPGNQDAATTGSSPMSSTAAPAQPVQGVVRDAIGRFMAVVIEGSHAPCPGTDIDLEMLPPEGNALPTVAKGTVTLLEGSEALVRLAADPGRIEAGRNVRLTGACSLTLAKSPASLSPSGVAQSAVPVWIGLQVENTRDDVRVRRAWPGSPAAKARFLAGDRLLRLDGSVITEMKSFVAATARVPAGQPIAVEVLRDGKLQEITVVPEPKPEDRELVRRITELATRGDHEAEFRLGMFYAQGFGMSQRDPETANLWLQKAARALHPEAQFELGLNLLNGTGTEKNTAEGVSSMTKAAEQGFAPAEVFLGRLYREGNGVDKNPIAAMQWYWRAVDKGHLPALSEVGVLFERGELVTKDLVQAREYYRISAMRGSTLGSLKYGQALAAGYGGSVDPDEAVWWLKQAVNDGNHDAECLLGDLYVSGTGLTADTSVAWELFQRAAKANHPGGIYRVGWCYAQGRGVEQNVLEAVTWYRRAAEAGFPDAQMELGVHLARGLGTARNETEAFAWIKKAAEQGHARSQYNLSSLYYEGRGVAKDYQKALEWSQKSAEAGDAHGENMMGVLLSEGLGTPADLKAAAGWFQKAADKGLAKAKYNLGTMYAEGRGVAADRAAALRWMQQAAELGDQSAVQYLERMKTTP